MNAAMEGRMQSEIMGEAQGRERAVVDKKMATPFMHFTSTATVAAAALQWLSRVTCRCAAGRPSLGFPLSY